MMRAEHRLARMDTPVGARNVLLLHYFGVSFVFLFFAALINYFSRKSIRLVFVEQSLVSASASISRSKRE